MNDPKKKPEPGPVEAGPVVSQAATEPVDAAAAAAAAVPPPADVPPPLSQVPSVGWSGVNIPKRT